MKSGSVLVLCISLELIGANALRLDKRNDLGVLKIPLQRQTPKVLSRKRQTVQAPDINYENSLLYIVELQIGTPPQSTFVQLDTGSSDLVVETPSSDICSANIPNPCTNFGSYSPNSSSTYEYIDSDLQVAYAGGDGATGDWVSDVVSLGGAVLQGAQFGIMDHTTVLEGILGVSYEIIESRPTMSGKPQYPNFPVLLVEQGYIASRAFSLYTNDHRSAGGTLLFGGIDTNKFSGELITLDLQASGSDGFPGVVDFTVRLNGVTGTDAGGNAVTLVGSTTLLVLMDSGTTLTLLPFNLASSIWNFVGATPDPNNPNLANIPCSAQSNPLLVNFVFNGITVDVPLSQLVIFPDSNSGLCLFGISATTSDNVIGDTVLSAMYVVYDLDNNQISLAPAVFNSTTENIIQIKAGVCGTPNSSQCSTSSTSSSATTSTTSTSSTAKPTVTEPSDCNKNNCLRGIERASVMEFCSAFDAGVIASTPIAIAKACHTLPSRISTGCACYVTQTSQSTPTAKPLCNKDNCLREVSKTENVPFCNAYMSTAAGVAVPTDIAEDCANSASRVSSACACLITKV